MALLWAAAERDRQQREASSRHREDDNTAYAPPQSNPLKEYLLPFYNNIFDEVEKQFKFFGATPVSAKISFYNTIEKYAYLEIESNAAYRLTTTLTFKIVAMEETNQASVTVFMLYSCPGQLYDEIVKQTDVFIGRCAPDCTIDELSHQINTQQKFSDYIRPILKILTTIVILTYGFEHPNFPSLKPTEFTCQVTRRMLKITVKSTTFSIKVIPDRFISVTNNTTGASTDIKNVNAFINYIQQETGMQLTIHTKLEMQLQEFECELDKLISFEFAQ